MSDSDIADETPPARGVIHLVYVGPGDAPATFMWRFQGFDGDRIGVWKNLRGRVPGAIYTVESTNGGDTVYPATLRYTGDYAEDAAELQVRAAAKERRLAMERLERNASRTGEIDATLTDLLALARKLNRYRDRQALADYVYAKIHGA